MDGRNARYNSDLNFNWDLVFIDVDKEIILIILIPLYKRGKIKGELITTILTGVVKAGQYSTSK